MISDRVTFWWPFSPWIHPELIANAIAAHKANPPSVEMSRIARLHDSRPLSEDCA